MYQSGKALKLMLANYHNLLSKEQVIDHLLTEFKETGERRKK